jgi:hypothetical protein
LYFLKPNSDDTGLTPPPRPNAIINQGRADDLVITFVYPLLFVDSLPPSFVLVKRLTKPFLFYDLFGFSNKNYPYEADFVKI